MEYVIKPEGATHITINKIAAKYQIELPSDFIKWWHDSDSAIVCFGYKELQFFTVDEMIGEDIYHLEQYMPSSLPICMDGNGNIMCSKNRKL